MLLLASVSDLIKLVTSAGTPIDVHASYLDFEAATGVESITPVRTNTLITTATTTTIVGAPGDATTYRNVKFISIRNRDAAVSNNVTVEHYDGTNTVEIIKATLGPGQELFFFSSSGWFVLNADGTVGAAAASTSSSTASSTGSTTVGTVDATLFSANTNRKEIIITNVGITTIYIALGTAASATAYHIALSGCAIAHDGTGSTFVSDMWRGSIHVISSGAAGLVVSAELT